MTVGRFRKLGLLAAAALWASIPAMATDKNTGDPARGKKVFQQCMACHSVEPGQNRLGPTLHNVIGRKAGTVEGFNYSEAHKKSGIVWTRETLNPYLKNPAKYMPNNRMFFAGVKDDQQRADLIAYLSSPEVSPDAASGNGGDTEDSGKDGE